MIFTLVNDRGNLITWDSEIKEKSSLFDYCVSCDSEVYTENNFDGFIDIYVGF